MPIYTYTGGTQSVVFTKDVTYLVELWGAESINSGSAGYANALVKTTSNTTLYLYIGGSPAHSTSPWTGGYNGGGNGGSVGIYTEATSRGFGGGGATDLRTSTSTSSVQSYKILVAGGAGGGTYWGSWGGGAGENGSPYPRQEDSDGETYDCGGTGATESSAGVGGLAPYRPNFEGSNDGTYFVASGGGGGGGYYGGGGGSTSKVYCYGTARTFGAGSAGNSSGTGGAGGGITSGYSATGVQGQGGGGGGGSDFYRDSYANFLGGTTYMRSGILPSKPMDTAHGIARIYPIYSQPEVRNISREGNYIYVTIGKTLDNNIEELFYCYGSFGKSSGSQGKIGYGDAYIITGSESNTLRYYINKGTHGKNVFTFTMVNGVDSLLYTYEYTMSTNPPEISFNDNVLSSKLIQGNVVEDVFEVVTPYEGIDYRSETILIIDDVEYPYTFSQGVGQHSIQLPYLYDGKNKQTYRLKIKTRVCQTAQSAYGTGKDIWSNWIETEELLVYAVAPQNNNLKFTTELKDRAIKRSTKVNLAWEEKRLTRLNDKQYRLMLYDGDNIVQTFDTPNTSIDVVLDYPHNKYYRFGVSILINGFLSEVVYSDKFFLTDIDPSSVSLSNDLTVSTSIEQTFDRIDVLINNETRILSRENINEKLPVYFFKNGNNDVNIKLYATDTDFISHKYRVHIAYDEAELTPSKVLDIKSTVTINGQDNEPLKMSNKADQAIDLGIAEKEMSIVGIGGGVIEEITQKITVTKIDQGANSRMQLLEILGSVE